MSCSLMKETITFWNKYARRHFTQGETLLLFNTEISWNTWKTETKRNLNCWYDTMILTCEGENSQYALWTCAKTDNIGMAHTFPICALSPLPFRQLPYGMCNVDMRRSLRRAMTLYRNRFIRHRIILWSSEQKQNIALLPPLSCRSKEPIVS